MALYIQTIIFVAPESSGSQLHTSIVIGGEWGVSPIKAYQKGSPLMPDVVV